MLFSKRIKEKEKIIMTLDDDITRLQEQKTGLAIDIERRQAEYDKISDKIQLSSDFLRLEEQRDASKSSLDALNDEIKKAELELEKINEKIKLKKNELEILGECSSLNELNEKLKYDISLKVNELIQEILSKFPDVKPTCLNFHGKNVNSTDSVKYVINSELTKFAISHGLDPMNYKNIICTYNSEWFKEFEKVAYTLNCRITFNVNELLTHPLLQCFVVLE